MLVEYCLPNSIIPKRWRKPKGNQEWTMAQRPWQHPAQKAKDEDKQNNTDSNKNRG